MNGEFVVNKESSDDGEFRDDDKSEIDEELGDDEEFAVYHVVVEWACRRRMAVSL